MQHRIVAPGPLHDENGRLIETGYATEQIKTYDRARIAASRLRIKEWDYYAVCCDRFALALVRYEEDTPSSVSWTFDGQAVQADAVTLAAGAHTVEAHLTYPDGSVEVIRLVINAE